ncbi:phosphoribosylglycinamide synthetase C domain-containing protein [Pseudomonas aeruginosa]
MFHAGTALKDGQVVTSGGRVLCATAIGERVRRPATGLSPGQKIRWNGCFYRKGHRLPCHRPRARRGPDRARSRGRRTALPRPMPCHGHLAIIRPFTFEGTSPWYGFGSP